MFHLSNAKLNRFSAEIAAARFGSVAMPMCCCVCMVHTGGIARC
ncbi:hypothetical protein [Ruminococcus sp.]|nr:hypothetical protein [Ruminococcus sp.]